MNADEIGHFLFLISIVMVLAFFVYTLDALTTKDKVVNIIYGQAREIEQEGGLTASLYNQLYSDISNIKNVSNVSISCPSSGLKYRTSIDFTVTYNLNFMSFNGSKFNAISVPMSVSKHFTSEKGR